MRRASVITVASLPLLLGLVLAAIGATPRQDAPAKGAPKTANGDEVERARGPSDPAKKSEEAKESPTTDKWEGMTISCPMDGREWATDATVETFRELKDLGVDWVVIHPYAGIREDGSLRVRSLDPAPAMITRPIEEAHRLGLKIAIKPHLAYWGSKFSWRGEIAFESEEQWSRFFTEYRAWIVRMAEISRDADLFVVGTELDKTISHVDEWQRIIREVKTKYSGRTTYAANWTDYHRVSFWDQLDFIGVQGYFPLVSHGEPATQQAIREGWKRVALGLSEYAQVIGRPILFTELGYNLSQHAAHKPWDYDTGGPDAERIQRDCMDAALEAIRDYPHLVGAFLWKVFPQGFRPPRNFSMQTPEMRDLIRRHWGK